VARGIDKVKPASVFGGSNIAKQIVALRKANIVVGTPGRIIDHLGRKTLKLNNLKVLVLDEADEMLNMGFKEDIEEILKTTPKSRQTLLFSATFPPFIKKITTQYQNNAVNVEVGRDNQGHKNISQQYFLSGLKTKNADIIKFINNQNINSAIIFCNTKRMVEVVADNLNKSGLNAVALHGDMRQSERRRVMQKAKSGQEVFLVATDVAARGIDIDDVTHVLNYDLPQNMEYYLHRIGRTARGGKKGKAITFINTKDQLRALKDYEKQTQSKILQIGISGTVIQDEADTLEDIVSKSKAKRESNNRGKSNHRTNSSVEYSRTSKRSSSNNRSNAESRNNNHDRKSFSSNSYQDNKRSSSSRHGNERKDSSRFSRNDDTRGGRKNYSAEHSDHITPKRFNSKNTAKPNSNYDVFDKKPASKDKTRNVSSKNSEYNYSNTSYSSSKSSRPSRRDDSKYTTSFDNNDKFDGNKGRKGNPLNRSKNKDDNSFSRDRKSDVIKNRSNSSFNDSSQGSSFGGRSSREKNTSFNPDSNQGRKSFTRSSGQGGKSFGGNSRQGNRSFSDNPSQSKQSRNSFGDNKKQAHRKDSSYSPRTFSTFGGDYADNQRPTTRKPKTSKKGPHKSIKQSGRKNRGK